MPGGGGLAQRAVCGGGDVGGMWHKGGRNAVRGSADAVRDRDTARWRDAARGSDAARGRDAARGSGDAVRGRDVARGSGTTQVSKGKTIKKKKKTYKS